MSSARRLLGFLVVLAAFVAIATVPACVPPPAERPPPCATQDLVTLEAAYVADAVAACKGRPMTACPELAPIEAKYHDKREEWIRCRR